MSGKPTPARIEYCPECGAYIPEGSKRCLSCGKTFRIAMTVREMCADCTKYDQSAERCSIGYEYLCSLKLRKDEEEPEEIPTSNDIHNIHKNLLGFQALESGTVFKPSENAYTCANGNAEVEALRILVDQLIDQETPQKDDKPPIIDLEPILGGNGRVKIGNLLLKDARIEPPGMKIDMEELGLARDMTGRARRGKLMAEVTLTIVGEVY